MEIKIILKFDGGWDSDIELLSAINKSPAQVDLTKGGIAKPKKRKQYVKITKCSGENFWYKEKIGMEFEVIDYEYMDNHWNFVVVFNKSRTGRGYIQFEDAEPYLK